MPTHNNHDIVVIGASAGGLDAVSRLVAGLPQDLAAAVFVVIHLDPSHESRLADLLNRPGGLPARTAENGEPIQPGRIFVAPQDRHLLLRTDRVEVVHGPRENGHRPAVDALFRTASAAFGSRVIGVVLTGNMDCGTAGLLSIKSRGGLAVVQDPAEARAPSMPSSAIAHVAVDHVARLTDMPSLLDRLVKSKAAPWPPEVRGEVRELEGAKLGSAEAELVCPDCHGKLTVSHVDGYFMFRCHVGHAYSLQGVTAAQAEEVETALWGSVRALEEAAALSRRVADSMGGGMRDRMLEKEQTQREQADVVRALVLGGQSLAPGDAQLLAAKPPSREDENTVGQGNGSAAAPRRRTARPRRSPARAKRGR